MRPLQDPFFKTDISCFRLWLKISTFIIIIIIVSFRLFDSSRVLYLPHRTLLAFEISELFSSYTTIVSTKNFTVMIHHRPEVHIPDQCFWTCIHTLGSSAFW